LPQGELDEDRILDEEDHKISFVGEKELYRDNYVLITNEAITLHCYYFPVGTGKRIPFKNIKYVTTDEQEELSWLDYKTWGMGLTNIWWAWGTGRSALFWDEKQVNLIIETGSWFRKGCTVEDINQVLGILGNYVTTCHSGSGGNKIEDSSNAL